VSGGVCAPSLIGDSRQQPTQIVARTDLAVFVGGRLRSIIRGHHGRPVAYPRRTCIASLVTADEWQEHVRRFTEDADKVVNLKPGHDQAVLSVDTMTVGDPAGDTGWITANEIAEHLSTGGSSTRTNWRRDVLARFSIEPVSLLVVTFLQQVLGWPHADRALLRKDDRGRSARGDRPLR